MKNVGEQNRISTHDSGLRQLCQHIVLAILLLVSLPGRADPGPLVAAASSLRSLWPALVDSYTSETGKTEPRVSFGSSGLLATQIINGAPFELFLSADLASINRLPKDRLLAPPRAYALGELHVVVPLNSMLAEALSLDAVAKLIKNPTDGNRPRLAIPNPAHAPYGQAAREALQSAGIWPLPAEQLLAAENAAQTLQFVRSGAVEAAIVPQSLVHAHAERVESVPVPAGSYTPVAHTLAVFDTARISAQHFATWLQEPGAAIVFEAAGLSVVKTEKSR